MSMNYNEVEGYSKLIQSFDPGAKNAYLEITLSDRGQVSGNGYQTMRVWKNPKSQYLIEIIYKNRCFVKNGLSIYGAIYDMVRVCDYDDPAVISGYDLQELRGD